MAEFIDIMFAPFCAALILAGIHVYLGLHVIQRQIIFVDLAFAQIAALGATLGYFWGFELHSVGSFVTSLCATFVAALVFTLMRRGLRNIPQEALIGSAYAVAAAACVLVLSKSPEGGEELKSLLVGHLLFVNWHEIGQMLLIYALVGVLHFFARSQFWAASRAGESQLSGKRLLRWDFLFYASFGLVVTSSTELAGVLLVFCYLIIPSICGIIFGNGTLSRLLVGWTVSFVASCAGLIFSYVLDLPTGATIVCTFGAALGICLIVKRFTC